MTDDKCQIADANEMHLFVISQWQQPAEYTTVRGSNKITPPGYTQRTGIIKTGMPTRG
jgi:hypothetical protein